MIKEVMLLGVLAFNGAGVASTTTPPTLTIKESEGGDINVEVFRGTDKIYNTDYLGGDKVIFTFVAHENYELKDWKVEVLNEVAPAIQKETENSYWFIMDTYGVYVLSAEFGESVPVLDQFELWLKTFLEPKTVTLIMGALTYAITIIVAIYNLFKERKLARFSNVDLKNKILEEMRENLSEEVKTQLNEGINSVLKICKNSNDIMAVLTKVLSLSQQEPTAETKLAILECIAQLGVVENLATTKEAVIKEEKAKIEKKEEVLTKIENMKAKGDDGTTI